MRIIAGQDEYMAEWAGSLLGVRFQEPYTAFGFVERDHLKGAVIFNDYYPNGNVEITFVGSHAFRKQQIAFMCHYAFRDLRCTRVTARTARGNTLMRKILPRFGFEYEGVQKRFYGNTADADAIVFVMWPDAAEKWLKAGGVQ